MSRPARALAAVLLALVAAGCARERVLLLPPEGEAPSGAVAVLPNNGAPTVIEEPNTEARLGIGSVRVRAVDPDYVRNRYGSVIDALPDPPAVYVLYFRAGSAQLEPESEPALAALRMDLAQRPGADVQITGHTDRVGAVEDNDALSLRRAREVAVELVAQGLDPEKVIVAGRGERRPLVPTGDGVAEPRNRRVEITVR